MSGTTSSSLKEADKRESNPDSAYTFDMSTCLDLSSETPTATLSVDADGGEYRVYDERSKMLSSIHIAGECLARATSMEFLGDGSYSVHAMNLC